MFHTTDPDPNASSVDGFSDSETGSTGEPDPGRSSDAPAPLSPEEYAAAQREARQED